MNTREYEKQGLTLKEYSNIHMYINSKFNKKRRCERCGNTQCSRTEWALIKGRKYSKNISDYQELCPSCHRKQDITDEFRKKVGKRMSDNLRNGNYKCRLPKYNRENHPTNRAVIQIDKNTGKYINEYKSVTQACLNVSGKITGAIQNNIKGLSNSAYGFKWKYKDE